MADIISDMSVSSEELVSWPESSDDSGVIVASTIRPGGTGTGLAALNSDQVLSQPHTESLWGPTLASSASWGKPGRPVGTAGLKVRGVEGRGQRKSSWEKGYERLESERETKEA